MESGRRKQSADWTGRLLAIVSLAVAIGAGGYAVMQHHGMGDADDPQAELETQFQALVAEHDALKSQLTKRIEDAVDRYDKRLTEWNSRLNTATQSFKADADKLLDQIGKAELQASNERYTAFKQSLADFRSEWEGEFEATNEASSSELPDDQPSSAHLTLADTRLRPTDGDTTVIRLENKSDEEVVIRRLRFKPESDFRVDPATVAESAADSDLVTIAYAASDNMSTNPGLHGLYVRELDEPIRVPAGEDLNMRVVIDDPKHDGWGFVGQLMLEYNSDNPLIIKVAHVRFD